MQLIGHNSQLELLRRAATEKRLAHAYLFSGPSGVGKRLVAKIFVMELFCKHAGPTIPCFSCDQCLKIQHDTHPDVFTIAAEKKDITIEQLRTVQAEIQMHPLEGPYKIVVIDDAEKANASSANSILKTLEEPPQSTIFFLITSLEHMLLPTIISRCQRMSFSPLPQDELVSYLKKELSVDTDTAKRIADVSGGSIGVAMTFPVDLLDDVSTTIINLSKGIKQSEILLMAQKWADEDSEAVLSTIACIYHDAITGKKSQFADAVGSLKALPASLLNKHMSAILSAQADLGTTYNKQLMFESLLFRLTS